MGKDSKIEWTHHTFNPWWGCTKVSPGCANCYAETLSHRLGHDIWGPRKPRRFFGDDHWREPLKWDAKAAKAGQPARVFCGSMCDVFEWSPFMPDIYLGQWRMKLWDLIERTPNLIWMLLTKRPEAVNDLVPALWTHGRWPANVWIGTSVEDQFRAGERIPALLDIPARVRFLSCEPLLEAVTIPITQLFRIDWVIIGGESGPGARPMATEWALSLRDQAYGSSGTRLFVKQLGGHPDKRGRLEDLPEHMRIREFPF